MEMNASLPSTFDQFMAVLDEGPRALPHTAAIIAVATPVLLLLLSITIMLCRGVPYACCGLAYFGRLPKDPVGLDPESGAGEHQDEAVEDDNDSVDEEEEAQADQAQAADDEMEDVDLDSGKTRERLTQRLAAVLENGEME